MRMWTPSFCGALVVLAAMGACSGTPTAVSPPQPGDATITITAGGVSPGTVVVAAGSRVRFVNNDSRVHQMYSDPHPEHGDCPEFDQVGTLAPGQSRFTGNLNTTRTCRFHDHEHFADPSLKGSVRIQ